MKLRELAPVIRSKNAGPYWYTIDVIFDDPDIYAAVKKSRIITRELISKRYNNVDINKISEIIYFDEGRGFKFNIRRPFSSGSPYDYDVLGMQQHAPMLDVEIPFHKIYMKGR
jgi:hypothetical protein